MIGAAITAALPVMRAHAASLRLDTCTVERAVSAWSEADRKTVTTWSPVLADIPCHLDEPSASSGSLLTGEAVTLDAPLVRVAHDVVGILPDDRITVGAHPPLWVTHAAHDDSTHPVELLIQCRRVR